MVNMDAEKASKLREPFPKSAIGKLPKGGVQLDYVGHAAVTDRLLSIDPEWSWEPMGVDPNTGLPVTDAKGNLWIKLTVCGVTRIGVGDGKSAKECIGDAIRNAAMRFGVALDLWSKDELEQTSGEGATKLRATLAQAPTAPPAPLAEPAKSAEPEAITPAQVKKLAATMTELKMTDRAEALAYVESVIGRPVGSRNELTKVEAMRVINALQEGVPA